MIKVKMRKRRIKLAVFLGMMVGRMRKRKGVVSKKKVGFLGIKAMKEEKEGFFLIQAKKEKEIVCLDL
jgi:hypothetical protein